VNAPAASVPAVADYNGVMDAKEIRLENLRILVDEVGGQRRLALRAGVNPAYLSQIMSERTARTMGDDVARRLERGTDKPRGWMDVRHGAAAPYAVPPGATAAAAREVDDLAAQYGSGATARLGPVSSPMLRLPLISWVTAGQWREVVDNFQPGDAEQWVETTKRVGRSAFALRVRGDSMEPRCPDGAIIVVDPEREAVNGSLVVVRLQDDAEATFKRLVVEGGRRFLAPLNPRYPVIEIDGPAVICGVVRQVLIDLD
jgi:SOS-response transcriptional repressor LexA